MKQKSLITLESLDRPGTLDINGIDPVDLWTMLGPLIGIPMLASMLGVPAVLGIVGGVVGLIAGVIVVYATPTHLNVVETSKVWRYYLKQPTEVRSFEDAATESDESIVKSIQTSKTTEEYLEIEKYYPEQNVIKRTDGSYAGLIKLQPPNLDFTEGTMTKITENIGNYYNEQVDFNTTIYVTTKRFDIEGYISNLESRRASSDAQDKPIAKALLDEQISERPKQLEETGTQKTQYYLLVETKQRSIHTSAVQDKTPVERLTEIPFLGIFAEIFINVSDDSTDLEQHGESLQTLKKRMNRTKRGISGGIDGWDATEVQLAEWLLFLQRFNKGRTVQGSAPIRQQSVQTTSVDGEKSSSDSSEDAGEGDDDGGDDGDSQEDNDTTDADESDADATVDTPNSEKDEQGESGDSPEQVGTTQSQSGGDLENVFQEDEASSDADASTDTSDTNSDSEEGDNE